MRSSTSGVSLATLDSSDKRSVCSGKRDSVGSLVGSDTVASSSKAEDLSADILSQSMALTNLIFGIYAVELWHFDESSGRLVNFALGSGDEETGEGSCSLLLKRRTQETDVDNDYASMHAIDAFNQLTDPSRGDYLPADPVDPGVGLPGALWAESHSSNSLNALGEGVRKRTNQLLHMGHLHGSTGNMSSSQRGGFFHHTHWRDVVELANDPDQVS